MMTANKSLRDMLKAEHIALWEVAHKLNVCEGTLIRKLRFDLADREQEKILQIATQILEERKSKSVVQSKFM
jgi:hypothetical protein